MRSSPTTVGTPLWQCERDFRLKVIDHTLAITRGNRTQAAAMLGLNRTYFLRLMKTLARPDPVVT